MGISQGFVSLELTPLKGGSRRRRKKERGKKNLRHVTVVMRLLSRCRIALGTRGPPGRWLS